MPTVKDLTNRLKDMQQMRVNFESHWQEIANWIVPEEDVIRTHVAGARRRDHLFDSTAPDALDRLANAIMGMLVNPGIRWFGLSTTDERVNESQVFRQWKDVVEREVYAMLADPATQFYTAAHEVVRSASGFGTGTMTAENTKTGLRFQSRPIGACYLAENPDGFIEEIIYRTQMTGRSIKAKYPEPFEFDEALGKKIRDAEVYPVLQWIYPDSSYDPGARNSRRYASLHALEGHDVLLKEGGFDRFPFVATRFYRLPGEVWGRSPGMRALPDVRMVNYLGKVVLYAAEAQVDPPIMMPNHGFMRPVQRHPGAVNYYNPLQALNGLKAEPLFSANNPQIGEALLQQRQANIRRHFFEDIFSLPEIDRMTATEAQIRQDDRLQMMSAVITRLATEMLDPIVSLCVQRVIEMKKLPVPSAAAQSGVRIYYLGPMALAQRAGELNPVRRLLQELIPVAQIDPGVLDILDMEAIARELADKTNVPARVIRSAQAIAQMREQRQQAQQMQAMGDASEAALNIARAQSELGGVV